MSEKPKKLKKMHIKHLLQIKHEDLSEMLSPEMKAALGTIDGGFDVFIFGDSGSGKSSFASALIKELSPLGRKLHLVYEEGYSKSVKMNIERTGLQALASEQYEFAENCTFDQLMHLLSRRNAPKIVVIDSFQYARFTKRQWMELKDKYVKGRKKKIFIVISHADGKKPRGSVAIDALYDAQIKVFVKGRIAFVKSRYENQKNYVVHEEGAKAFWGRQYKKMLTKQIF